MRQSEPGERKFELTPRVPRSNLDRIEALFAWNTVGHATRRSGHGARFPLPGCSVL